MCLPSHCSLGAMMQRWGLTSFFITFGTVSWGKQNLFLHCPKEQTQKLPGATDLQGLTVPSLGFIVQAPSHHYMLHTMVASRFQHQVINPSWVREKFHVIQPKFPLFVVMSMPLPLFTSPLSCPPAAIYAFLSLPGQHYHWSERICLSKQTRAWKRCSFHNLCLPEGDLWYTQAHSIICTSSQPIRPLLVPVSSSPAQELSLCSPPALPVETPQGTIFLLSLQIFADHYRCPRPACHLSKQNRRRRATEVGQMDGGRVKWEPGEQSGHNDKENIKHRLGLSN